MDAENRAEPPDCAAAAKGNQDKCSNDLDVDQQSSTLADDSQLWREESTVGDLPLDTFKKKKKPKRVGGIAFAVEEQVQVIQTNQEDLTLRREHWQAIQEKANDPTTVYSNDNSRAPSGQSSPLKKFAEKGLAESAAIDDSRDESTAVSIKHILDHEELGNKLLELAAQKENAASSRTTDSTASPRPREAVCLGSSTSPFQGDGEHKVGIHETASLPGPTDSAASPRPKGASLGDHTSPSKEDGKHKKEDEQTPAVSEALAACETTEAHNSKMQQSDEGAGYTAGSDEAQREREEKERQDGEEKMQFLRTGKGKALDSPSREPKKRDPAIEPPSAGCPSLATPNLDSYISDKDRNELFRTMARGLLQYIGLFPIARKVPIPRDKVKLEEDKSKSKEEREREARLRAKAAAATKRREKDENLEDKKNKKDQPLPPKSEKTAMDFEYAIKRWLERTWKAGQALVNAYQIGMLMEADVQYLVKGATPILESKLESVWNGSGFVVQAMPLADVSEWDWRDLARRLRDQHLIGDKFFPSEEYMPQVGLAAMCVQQEREEDGIHSAANQARRISTSASTASGASREAIVAREKIFWNEDAQYWRDSTHVGLPAAFAASNQMIRWDFDDAGPIVRLNTKRANQIDGSMTEAPRTTASFTLTELVETSKKDWIKKGQKDGGRTPSRRSGLADEEGSDIGRTKMERSTSEPLLSDSMKLKSTGATYIGSKKRRDMSDEQRQKQVDDEKAFRRFIKLHTGRTRVSQRMIEECREPFRLYKLEQKRIAAVGYYAGVLGEMERDFEILAEQAEGDDDDDCFESDEKKVQRAFIEQLYPTTKQEDTDEKENTEKGPAAIIDINSILSKPKEKIKEKPPPMPMPERLRAATSMMTEVEKSFAQRRATVGKKEVAQQLEANLAAGEDDSRRTPDTEISFDEFLRRPMKTALTSDPNLVKSLRLYSAMVGETGLNELDVVKSLEMDARLSKRPPTNAKSKLPPVRASSGGSLPQVGRSWNESMNRRSESPSFSHITSLDSLIPPGGIPRRDGILSQNCQRFSNSGFQPSRSPYAQKMPSRFDDPKRRSTPGKQSGDWQSKFSKIASAEAAHVLAHIPTK